MSRDPRTAVTAVVVALLVGLTLSVFWPATGYGFINFDDPAYVTDNPSVLGGLSLDNLDGLRFAFNIGHTGNWIPLTWLSHMLDVSLFGVRPGYHHLHNILLHAINAALLFLVLRALAGRAAGEAPDAAALFACAFAAAVFAVHPLRLESVVWISERKDLLAGLFWMLSLLAYLAYTRRPGMGGLLGVTTLFGLGLMAKPMVISLPWVLCLLDVWPLRRLGQGDRAASRRALAEKVPLFLLAGASAVLTVVAQSRGGALSSVAAVSPGTRLAGAVVGYAGYLQDLLWPVRLSVFYPFPADGWPAGQVVASALVLGAITVAAVAGRRRYPWIAVAWGWYLIVAAPVIGLVKIGQQAGADRYTYLPLIGPTVALAWGAALATRRLRRPGLPRGIAAVVVVLALCLATRSQIGYWRDSRALFQRALTVTEDNHVAHYSLSLALEQEGDLEAALRHGHRALEIYPQLYAAYLHLAEIHARRGESDDARFLLGLAMNQEPDNPLGYHSLGRVLLAAGQPLEAVAAFREALARAPHLAEAHHDLGTAHEQLGRAEEALGDYAAATRIAPQYFEAWFDGGRLASMRGRPREARARLEHAARLRPRDPGVVSLLTLVLLELGDREAAEARYTQLVAMGAPGAPRVRELLDAGGAPERP